MKPNYCWALHFKFKDSCIQLTIKLRSETADVNLMNIWWHLFFWKRSNYCHLKNKNTLIHLRNLMVVKPSDHEMKSTRVLSAIDKRRCTVNHLDALSPFSTIQYHPINKDYFSNFLQSDKVEYIFILRISNNTGVKNIFSNPNRDETNKKRSGKIIFSNGN